LNWLASSASSAFCKGGEGWWQQGGVGEHWLRAGAW
jgi:hypothetical protein